MLQAMNTGHDGSLTTIHANSPRDALYRLDTMVAMANLNIPGAGDPPADRVGGQPHRPGVAHVRRHAQGDRHLRDHRAWKGKSSRCRTSSCSSGPGIGPDGKVCGRFRATGIRPKCSDDIAASGLRSAIGHVRTREGRGLRRVPMIIVLCHLHRDPRPRARGLLALRASGRSGGGGRAAQAAAARSSVGRQIPKKFRLAEADRAAEQCARAEQCRWARWVAVTAPLQRDITQAGLKFDGRHAAALVGLPRRSSVTSSFAS